METKLINIKVEDDQQLVSARDLYKVLEVKKRFSAWKEQNFKDFEEGTDFTGVPEGTPVKGGNGNVQYLDDYAVTLDMAKELCMMSKTAKGKEIRQYFIQVEKNWNSPEMIIQRALEISNARIQELQAQNKSLTLQLEESNKKASYLDIILGTPDLLATTQIAADYGYSARTFNQLLKEVGIQHKVNGQWILYKAYMGKGYVQSKSFAFKDRKGHDRSKPSTYWTQKGRKLIYDVLKENGTLPLIERDDIA
ncbi:phage antirepressor KilAC domain-containing protein [Lactobacillus delbrueckii subsp. bulgaricus]|uniref:Ant n=1 Tax=Lactococcus phage mv4 TaxID=12392 RepID=Q9G0C5_BPMV4|nr:phage antirepressor KilAC domain-containing protein [Lactobacillus delbrueckii]AAG31333.2 Ant [Lactobacillus phage mv4]MCD5464887.1 phage antirepressor KilAC domain-containing protein [Lactobacillus delbrueckii subsp. bulgaricus]MCD5482376.1 phage antirepressor KilAC domain-containing protein [Lactobacillus delbrueckii subsp. bulgaricus]MCD5482428.1 phage antirepressor KilAC domain-containing protein [Lactobacillus delbrueckii subsp. bulgaricus]MCT3468550.1 phage antirepressor Ant [Lactobac